MVIDVLNLEKLALLRKRKGYSQAKLAKKVGIDSSHLSNIENGKRAASMETLIAILQALEADITEVWDDDGTLPPIVPSVSDRGIVVENGEGATKTRYILPPTRESYALIAEQIREWNRTVDPQLSQFISEWKQLDEHDRQQLIQIITTLKKHKSDNT